MKIGLTFKMLVERLTGSLTRSEIVLVVPGVPGTDGSRGIGSERK